MRTGPDARAPDPDDEIVGADVRELLATDGERAPADLHAVVAAMAREAQGLPHAASLPARALPRWQRLVPIAAVLVLSVGVVPLVVRDAPTAPEGVALESAPAPAASDAVVPEASLAESEPAPGAFAPEPSGMADAPGASAPAPAPRGDVASDDASRARSSALAARSLGVDAAAVPARPPAAVQKLGTPRDGARRIIERLRARGVDAALESYAAWRASWPGADFAELVGEAGEGELERLREAVALGGLPPLSPSP